MAEGDRRRRRFTIVGAGLGGALTAVFLGRRGHEVRVFERRNDPRTGPLGRSRSINLAISVRGLHALEQVWLAAPITKESVSELGWLEVNNTGPAAGTRSAWNRSMRRK